MNKSLLLFKELKYEKIIREIEKDVKRLKTLISENEKNE